MKVLSLLEQCADAYRRNDMTEYFRLFVILSDVTTAAAKVALAEVRQHHRDICHGKEVA